MIIIPAIDLRGGRCVRLTQGRKNSTTVYDANPLEAAQAFAAAGAEMLHVVDLDGAFADHNTQNRQVLRDLIAVLNIPIQFGGGLRRLEDVEEVIKLGVARVVVGTVAAESPETLSAMLHSFGVTRIVVGIDAHNGLVRTHGWERKQSISALDLARKVAALGVERVTHTDIQRDGTLSGPNLEQACLIAETGLKVTVAGGISSLEDLKSVKSCGLDSVIVGKALYEGRFGLEAALATASG